LIHVGLIKIVDIHSLIRLLPEHHHRGKICPSRRLTAVRVRLVSRCHSNQNLYDDRRQNPVEKQVQGDIYREERLNIQHIVSYRLRVVAQDIDLHSSCASTIDDHVEQQTNRVARVRLDRAEESTSVSTLDRHVIGTESTAHSMAFASTD
jgi:hypothetical protein